MKFFHLSVFFIMVFSFFGTAQELVFELDFEDQTVGTEITKRNTLQFQGWNKSVRTVGQEEDNKVATSTTQAKVFLIKSCELDYGFFTIRNVLPQKLHQNGFSKFCVFVHVCSCNCYFMHYFVVCKINGL